MAAGRQARCGLGVYYLVVGALLLTNAFTAVALTTTPEISRLFSGQQQMLVSAYEDRITQLRVELDRLQSRSFAQAGDINLQLQELSAQQEMLAEHHTLVQVLVSKAQELGLEGASPALTSSNDAAPVPAAITSDRVSQAVSQLDAMLNQSRAAVSAIAVAATERADAITGALDGVGIAISEPEAELLGVGGPLLAPMPDAGGDAMIESANSALVALSRYQAAREALTLAPVHMPIVSSFRQSSGFGNRRDPFSGGRAFHAGLDFAAPTGTLILSAGMGKVVFAGTRAGYGNLVEIDHGDGLVTRYAHMSAILVRAGMEISTGQVIGRVGSTGRSTGPHLHFEVRRGDTPLDPAAFLAVGRRLAAELAV
jgi:murein DD-endopeptidase MepM/ murein hydrolase activator NlpD